MLAILAVLGALAAPSGYHQVASATGASLWRQDWPQGEPDFVLEVDLQQARFESVVDPTGGTLWRHTVPGWWNDHGHGDQFAVLNGAFFNPNIDPTEPAFGLKTPVYVHGGYGTAAEYVGQQLAVHLDGTHAWVYGADPSMLSGGAPDQVVALSPYADKSASSWLPRTFVGLRDWDGTGFRTVLVFQSLLATQAYARDELARWGTTEVVMLDGGGSTQLRAQGVDHISSSRAVPHVYRVLAGRPSGGGDPPDTDPPDTDPPDTDPPDTDPPDTDPPDTDPPDTDPPGDAPDDDPPEGGDDGGSDDGLRPTDAGAGCGGGDLRPTDDGTTCATSAAGPWWSLALLLVVGRRRRGAPLQPHELPGDQLAVR